MLTHFSGLLRKKQLRNLYIAVSAYITVYSLDHYLIDNNVFGRQTILNIVLFFCLLELYSSQTNLAPHKKKCCFIFAAGFAIFLIVGQTVSSVSSAFFLLTSKSLVIRTLGCIYGFFVLFYHLVSHFLIWLTKQERNSQSSQWKVYKLPFRVFIIWTLIFCAWIPSIYAYYPGILSYDSRAQTFQALASISDGFLSGYNNNHPVIHTLLLELCMRLGRIVQIEPILIYTVFQKALLSLSFAMLINYMIDRKSPNGIVLLALVFFALNPVMAIMSGSMTKDVIFAVFLVLFTLRVAEMVSDPNGFTASRSKVISSGFFLLMMCLLRNIALLVGVLMLAVVGWKKEVRKVTITWMVCLVIFCGINWPLFDALGIRSRASGELLSIPMQQLARVVVENTDKLEEKEKEQLDHFLDYSLYSGYNPRFADPVKSDFNDDYYRSHKLEFYQLWFHLFQRFPGEYFDAFLAQNVPYLYPDTETPDLISERVYIETENYIEPYRDSKLPGLLGIYEKIASYDAVKNVPVISTVFSTAFPFWLMMFGIFVLAAYHQYKKITVILPSLFYQMSFLLGPVNNFRYIFPVLCIFPLIVHLVFSQCEEQTSEDHC